MLIRIPEYKKEIKKIFNVELPYSQLKNSSILVAGASGMIGSAIVDGLMTLSEINQLELSIYVLGRSKARLEKRFVSYLNNSNFHILEHDIEEPMNYTMQLDYIIHAASDANPVAYAKSPVEIMKANFVGMSNLLDYGKKVSAKRVLYISSGEMYGKLQENLQGFSEDYVGYVDYSDPRSCYPSVKRATEVLCQSYVQEYNMDIVIVRPCHIYGPTMIETDTRAVSSFLRNALTGQDIVLKSDGSARRTMCYVMDAVSGILTVLLCGKKGQAYNISDEKSEVSILELANLIGQVSKSKVVFEMPNEIERAGFNRVQSAVLLSEKLRKLGWVTQTEIGNALESTLLILKELEELNCGESI